MTFEGQMEKRASAPLLMAAVLDVVRAYRALNALWNVSMARMCALRQKTLVGSVGAADFRRFR